MDRRLFVAGLDRFAISPPAHRALARHDREIAQKKGRCSIIDIGGTRKYWSIVPLDFLVEHRVSVLITNIDDNTGKSPAANASDDGGVFAYAFADACDLPYVDKSFDIAHSNSVIEHVGTWENQIRFRQEIGRVASAILCRRRTIGFHGNRISARSAFSFCRRRCRYRC